MSAERLPELLQWLHACRDNSKLQVKRIDWADCAEWSLSPNGIEHNSGGFFSIRGLACLMPPGGLVAQARPMILQPEIGILGFILRESKKGIEWLLQAKTEPGNQGGTQVAPSVQATESNYRQRHHGASTPHLAVFLEPQGHQLLADSLGSEQGNRFIGKYNRNMSVLLGAPLEQKLGPNLRWFSSLTLQRLLLADYSLNTDARSSIFTGDWRMLTGGMAPFAAPRSHFAERLQDSFHTEQDQCADLLDWLATLRHSAAPAVQMVALDELQDWRLSARSLYCLRSAGIEIQPYSVSALDREVTQWCQPLVRSTQRNRAEIYCQERGGVLRFLLRASWEIGFRESYQLGPSWQSDADGPQSDCLAGLDGDGVGELICQTLQSDEGGRFIDSLCRYQLRLLPDDLELSVDDHYRWLTLGQIHSVRNLQGILTNEARSLLSMLLAWA